MDHNLIVLIDENGHCEIPSSVTKISDYAFARCAALESVRLGHHDALRMYSDWFQIDCKCARLAWWESPDGRAFARDNGYTDKQTNAGLKALRKLMKGTF